MKKISRQDAMAQGLKRYFTGKPCKRGHVAERSVSGKNCIMCASLWEQDNKEKRKSTARKCYHKRYGDGETGYALKKKADESIRQKALRKSSPEWRAERNARSIARRDAVLLRTPAWADVSAIKEIYADAQKLTKKTGTPYEVDHIIPLHGRYVSGLHVETNLQVITAAKNRKKSNQF
jgi:hypothetical protein